MNNTTTTTPTTYSITATCPIDGDTFDVAVMDTGVAALHYISDTRFDFPDHTMTVTAHYSDHPSLHFYQTVNEGPPQ